MWDLVGLTGRRLPLLVNRSSIRRVKALARRIPASCVNFFGFEQPLAANSDCADFSVSLSQYGIHRFGTMHCWPQLEPVIQYCAEKRVDGDTVWLEFDTRSSAHRRRAPNVFVAVDREGPIATTHDVDALIDSGVAASTMRRVIADQVHRLIDKVPAGAGRVLIGFMLARPFRGVRLCVVPLTGDEAASYLHDAQWPGDVTHVALLLRRYAGAFDFVCLHLDVTNVVRPTLGIELFYEGWPMDLEPARQRRWARLCELLVSDGLCDECERTSLLRWPAEERFTAPRIDRWIAAMWPSDVRLVHGTLRTALHHVKLTLRGNEAIAAKAYFGACLDPVQ